MKKILFAVCFALLLVGCGNNKQDKYITEFKYEYGGGWSTTYSYEIKQKDDKYVFTYKETLKDADVIIKYVSKKNMKKLSDLIDKYEIDKWNGFDKSQDNIYDGSYFSLNVKYNNGDVINAHGYMMTPDNYNEASEELIDFLNGLK